MRGSNRYVTIIIIISLIFTSWVHLDTKENILSLEGEDADTPRVEAISFLDEFSDDSNITVSERAYLDDGNITLALNNVFADDFNRDDLEPWQLLAGHGNLAEGSLRLQSSEVSPATVKRRAGVMNLSLGGTFNYTFTPGTDPTLTFKLNSDNATFCYEIELDAGDVRLYIIGKKFGYRFVAMDSYEIAPNRTQSFKIQVIFGWMRFISGSSNTSGYGSGAWPRGEIESVEINLSGEAEINLDNFEASLPTTVNGTVISKPISLPEKSLWFSMTVKGTMDSRMLQLDILDSTTLRIIPGYGNLTTGKIDIEGVHFSRHQSISIRAELTSLGYEVPSLESWEVHWTEGYDLWMDSFDDMGNLTSSTGCRLYKGRLTGETQVSHDKFNRTQLAPWTTSSLRGDGSVSLVDGSGSFTGGTVNGSKTILEREIDMRDLSLEMQMYMTNIGEMGLNLTVYSDNGRGLRILWNYTSDSFEFHTNDGLGWSRFNKSYGIEIPEENEWFDVHLRIMRGRAVSAAVGSWMIGPEFDLYGNITKIRMTWGRGDNGFLDDVKLFRLYYEVKPVSEEVMCPEGKSWSMMRRWYREFLDEYVTIDILDGATSEPVPGYSNLSAPMVNLTGVDSVRHPSLRLRTRILNYGFYPSYLYEYTPSMDWYQLYWEPDEFDFFEPFDDGSILTSVSGGVGVVDGHLSTLNRILWDGFKRTQIEPWEIESGSAEIYEGHLSIHAFDGNSSRITNGFRPQDTFTMTTWLYPNELGINGFGIELSSKIDGGLAFIHYDPVNDNLILSGDDGINRPIGSAINYQMPETRWLKLEFQVQKGQIDVALDNTSLHMFGDGFETFDTINLYCHPGSDIRWESVIVDTPIEVGKALTLPIDVPRGEGWKYLEMLVSSVYSSSTKVTILDSETLRPIPGFENLFSQMVDISSIDPDVHDQIRLSFEMVGRNQSAASIDWFGFFWLNGPGEVIQKKDFEPIYMVEDLPRENVLNLTEYLTARELGPSGLTYEIVNVSNPEGIRPSIRGTFLSIDLPTENWNGEATFYIRCASVGSSLTAGPIVVMVEPIDDPPILAELGELDIVEEQSTEFDLGPFILDVDTPVNELRVTVDSNACSVQGLLLVFFFLEGGFDEAILVRVEDSTSEVDSILMLHIEAVDDTPVIDELPIIDMVEDAELTVDLSPYIHDEETPQGLLTLTCTDEGLRGIEGLNLTLMYPQGGDHILNISVSDGSISASSQLRVVVEEVNEAPIIDSIGNQAPPIEISLDEGEQAVLDVNAHDEEDDTLTYTLESDWTRMWLSEDGRIHISSEIGNIGTFTGILLVKDSQGATTTVELVIRVRLVNDPPFVPHILEPINNSVWEEGELIIFNVSAFDTDMVAGQELTIVWTSNASGELWSTSSLDPSWFSISTLPVGWHRISVRVDDGEFTRESWISIKVVSSEKPTPNPPDDNVDPERMGFIPYLILICVIAVLIPLVYWRNRKRYVK